MRGIVFEVSFLLLLLSFEVWNVFTARRRGRIFWKLTPIRKDIEPKEFRTALVFNTVFIGMIVSVMILRIYQYLSACLTNE